MENKQVNQLMVSEFEHETYVAPGTNFVLSKTWQQNLVNGLQARNTGLHIYGDHYVSVQANDENDFDFKCTVHTAEFYIEAGHSFKHVVEDGFIFFANKY